MGKQEWNVDESSIVLCTWSYLSWGRLGAWLLYHQCHFVSTKIWKNIKCSHLSLSQVTEQLRWKSLTFFPPSWAARTVLGELTDHEASRTQTRPTHNVAHATNAVCDGQFSGIPIKSSPSDIEVFFWEIKQI